MNAQSSKPLIIANWKADVLTYKEAEQKILQTYALLGKMVSKIELVFAPSITHIHTLKSLSEKHLKYTKPKKTKWSKLTLAAQNVSAYEGGAKTGEIPAVAVKDTGVKYVIVGHSECREMGDTNATVASKLQLVVAAKMSAVLCVGERERDTGVRYLKAIEDQIVSALSSIDKKNHNLITIAYEPVWAVNNENNTALDAHGLHSMVVYIRRLLLEKFGEETVRVIKILYGGSVSVENAQDIFWNGEVQGLLIGRASREPVSLTSLIKTLLINPKKNILKQYGPAKKHK